VRKETEELDRVMGAAKRTWSKKLAFQPRKSAGRCEAQGRDTTNADPAFETTSAVKSLAGRGASVNGYLSGRSCNDISRKREEAGNNRGTSGKYSLHA
jgi:hypothetical protein